MTKVANMYHDPAHYFASHFPHLNTVNVTEMLRRDEWDPNQPGQPQTVYFLLMRPMRTVFIRYKKRSFFQYEWNPPILPAAFAKFIKRSNTHEDSPCNVCGGDRQGQLNKVCPSCGFVKCHMCVKDVCQGCGADLQKWFLAEDRAEINRCMGLARKCITLSKSSSPSTWGQGNVHKADSQQASSSNSTAN
jgi:hypothetical protein